MKEILCYIEESYVIVLLRKPNQKFFETCQYQGEDRFYIEDLDNNYMDFWKWLVETAGICEDDNIKLCAVVFPSGNKNYIGLEDALSKYTAANQNNAFCNPLPGRENIWQEKCLQDVMDSLCSERPKYEVNSKASILKFHDKSAEIKGFHFNVVVELKKKPEPKKTIPKSIKSKQESASKLASTMNIDANVESKKSHVMPPVVHKKENNAVAKVKTAKKIVSDTNSLIETIHQPIVLPKDDGNDLQDWINKRTEHHITTEDFFG